MFPEGAQKKLRKKKKEMHWGRHMRIFQKLNRSKLTVTTGWPSYPTCHDLGMKIVYFVLTELLVFSKH